jgi:Pyridoxamine 5'-phosphate oxidase
VAKTYDQLDKRLHGWIAAQHIFFVATAPQRRGDHVNLSPKGHADTFAVLDERTVAYLDLTGSGAETAAHLRADRRITLMFCAFSGPPRILRLYGQGRIVLPGEQRWDELAAWFPARRGARAVVVVEVERIADSCGYAVPLYDYAGERDLLDQWAGRKDEAAMAAYRAQRNSRSIDGLPALPMAASDRWAGSGRGAG